MYFAKSTNGFYDPEINTYIPDDAVEITSDMYIELLTGQSTGKIITSDSVGNPVLVNPPSAPVIHPVLTPRQIRMALTRAGLRDEVEAAVAAGDQDLKDWWEWSGAFERNHPEVLAMQAALSVSNESLDLLWSLGATL